MAIYYDISDSFNDTKMGTLIPQLAYFSPNILNNKRFLTDQIWPCNMVKDNLVKYYFTPAGALKKYELHEPEDILLLNPYAYSQEKYENDLLRLIRENKP